jgi:rubrerythrin
MSFDLAAKARSRSSKSHDKAMGMYRCAVCGDWHLGNPSRAKQPIAELCGSPKRSVGESERTPGYAAGGKGELE